MNGKKIRLRFLSTMKHVAGCDETIIEIGAETTIADLLRLISRNLDTRVTQMIFEQGDNSIRNDLLILVNDVDIAVLAGADTLLSEGDEVSLMPIAHGG